VPSLPTIDQLMRLQRAYYEAISTWERRPWGMIGLNLDNPTSHDSNHAYADTRLTPAQLPEVLNDVAAWYAARAGGEIEPRLRFHVPPNDPQLVSLGESSGWKSDQIEQTWRAWPTAAGHEQPAQVPGMTLSVVGSDSLDALLAAHDGALEPDVAHRRRGVWSALSASDRVNCLLAQIHGDPAAALACVWNAEWGSLEDVYTRRRFRRRGICSAMIRHMQALAVDRGAAGLYLYDNEDAPDRIYARAGFELVARPRQAQLWLGALHPSHQPTLL